MAKTSSRLVDVIGVYVAVPLRLIKDEMLHYQARWLFTALRSYVNDENRTAFPSLDELTNRTGMDRHAIVRRMRELESAGWVERKRRFGGSTIYTLKYPPVISAESAPMDALTEAPISAESAPSLVRNPHCISAESYTLTRTNYLEPINQNTSGADAPRVQAPLEKDPLGHIFDRATKANPSETYIRAWHLPAHLEDMCLAFQNVTGVEVLKRDKGKWAAGARDLHELSATHDEIASVWRDRGKLTITHPGAMVELIKARRVITATTTTLPAAELEPVRLPNGDIEYREVAHV